MNLNFYGNFQEIPSTIELSSGDSAENDCVVADNNDSADANKEDENGTEDDDIIESSQAESQDDSRQVFL